MRLIIPHVPDLATRPVHAPTGSARWVHRRLGVVAISDPRPRPLGVPPCRPALMLSVLLSTAALNRGLGSVAKVAGHGPWAVFPCRSEERERVRRGCTPECSTAD